MICLPQTDRSVRPTLGLTKLPSPSLSAPQTKVSLSYHPPPLAFFLPLVKEVCGQAFHGLTKRKKIKDDSF